MGTCQAAAVTAAHARGAPPPPPPPPPPTVRAGVGCAYVCCEATDLNLAAIHCHLENVFPLQMGSPRMSHGALIVPIIKALQTYEYHLDSEC